ncbi:hypothetical protein J8273_7034 [Carpediemonas membranifera]|uniref:Uncharacterized protein n=1 Tax=Carpediemonas membranifera TaxID=201153 RepID=A0A8J6AQ00_9EUKA|nr:hypothetical protein J8273_7034 [Carpediemonas membranifera]|eukprot:KAG9390781.1 hypothetical protein J8273_7034 [Carpediemonas membranifera]
MIRANLKNASSQALAPFFTEKVFLSLLEAVKTASEVDALVNQAKSAEYKAMEQDAKDALRKEIVTRNIARASGTIAAIGDAFAWIRVADLVQRSSMRSRRVPTDAAVDNYRKAVTTAVLEAVPAIWADALAATREWMEEQDLSDKSVVNIDMLNQGITTIVASTPSHDIYREALKVASAGRPATLVGHMLSVATSMKRFIADSEVCQMLAGMYMSNLLGALPLETDNDVMLVKAIGPLAGALVEIVPHEARHPGLRMLDRGTVDDMQGLAEAIVDAL